MQATPDVAKEVESAGLWPAFARSFPHAYEERRRRPGVHALVIGVSSYTSLKDNPFGLSQLSCAASSAAEFADWLLRAYPHSGDMPLTSVRLLLSPSASEVARLQELDAVGVERAKREAVQLAVSDWATDCNSCAGNFAMLYVAGHGVAATDAGPHFLLEDFWRTPDLNASLYIPNIHSSLGFCPRVRRSTVFVDCCQQIPPRPELNLGKGITLSYNESIAEPRTGAAVYFAAPRGEAALGITGKRTLFLSALLDCLRGQASVKRVDADGWCVRSLSLGSALQQLMPHEQIIWPRIEGPEFDFEICRILETPKSSVTVRVQPVDSHSGAAGKIARETDGKSEPFEMSENPKKIPLDCGSYTVSLQTLAQVVSPPWRNVFVLPPMGAMADFEVSK